MWRRAISAWNAPGEAVADERGGSLDADTGKTTLAGRDAHVGGVQSGDLAEALIVRNAVDDQAVDIVETQSGVGERFLQRPQTELIGIVFRQLAVARVPYADDRDGF